MGGKDNDRDRHWVMGGMRRMTGRVRYWCLTLLRLNVSVHWCKSSYVSTSVIKFVNKLWRYCLDESAERVCTNSIITRSFISLNILTLP